MIFLCLFFGKPPAMELGIRVEEMSGSTMAALAVASALMIVLGASASLWGRYARRSFGTLGIASCAATAEYEDGDPGLCPHLANAIRAEINACLPPGRHLPMLDVRGVPRRPLVMRRRGASRDASPSGPVALADAPLESACRKIAEAMARHLPGLASRRVALVTIDEHGGLDDSAWRAEYRAAIGRLMPSTLTEAEAEALAAAGSDLVMAAWLSDPAWMEWAWRTASYSYHPGLRPSEYEALCAARLRTAGWQCRTGSADLAGTEADIVARKGDLTLVLRCWKSGSGIGQRLVQEADRAKARLGADIAAVVSNAPFSLSAIESARLTGTILLHHSELEVLEARLDPPAPPRAIRRAAAPRVCPDDAEDIWPC